jgi:predicted DNA-binding transcriptional regulator YafY
MSRNDRIARLFRVLDQLARSKRGLPLKIIADREGWKLRSLYRDIEALEQAGFPLVHENGRYRLIEGWAPATQLGVDAEELLALFLARQQTSGWRGTRVGDALERLYGKLAAPAKGPGVLVPRGLGESFSAAAPSARDYAAHARTVATLDRAAREHLVVTAVYESIDGEVMRRAIEPAQLHWDARLETLYVIAYCRVRQDIRIFAAHRFRAVTTGRTRYVPRPGVTSEAALRNAFRVWRDTHLVGVRLAFSGRAARLVAERRWHPTQKVKRQDASTIFEAEVAGFGEVIPWILSFGAECAVREPEELRERVRAAHLAAALGAEAREGARQRLR